MSSLKRGLAAMILLCAAAPVHASGAWTTWVKPYTFTDILVHGNSIWATSLEGGLLQWDRGAGSFTSITREPGGLASNALTAIAHDRRGRLWVGTQDHGVARLSADGRRWDVVNQLDGIPLGAVTTLTSLGDTLWIGTEQGVSLWNGNEVIGTLPDGINPSPFESDHVTGVVQHGDTVWVATLAGIYRSRISTALTTWVTVGDSLPDTQVDALASDGRSVLALCAGSVYVLNGRAWQRTSSLGIVHHLIEHDGVVIATADLGIFRWGGSNWLHASDTLRPARDNSNQVIPATVWVAAVDPLHAGDISGIAAVNAGGLEVWNGSAFEPHPIDAPTGNNLQNVVIDGARVYVDTFEEGIGRWDGRQWRNWPPTDCHCDTAFKNPTFAFSLVADRQSRIWAGLWGTSIDRYDGSTDPPTVAHFFTGGGDTVRRTFGWSTAIDSLTSSIWIGLDTYDRDQLPAIGMLEFDNAGNFRKLYQPGATAMHGGQVRAISADRRNELWLGYAGRGLQVFAVPSVPGDSLVERSPMSATATLDVFGIEAHGDSVWVMSTEGVQLYNAGNYLPIGPLLSYNGTPADRGAVHPMDVGPDGSVWVGSTAGVRAFHPGGGQEDFTLSNSPLASNEVRAIRVDKASGVVWIATSGGLNRYDPHYVAPPPPAQASIDASVYPNPARLSALGVSLKLSARVGSTYHGAIYDVNGRALHHFETRDGGLVWDGRDDHGGVVKPGVYFVRLEAGGRTATLRVALLH